MGEYADMEIERELDEMAEELFPIDEEDRELFDNTDEDDY